MSKTYLVKDGDFLSKIASDHGFHDGGAAILDANPELKDVSGENGDLLPPGFGLKIPNPARKVEKLKTGAEYRFQRKTWKKNLRVTLMGPPAADAPDGEPLKNWTYKLSVADSAIASGKTGSDGIIDVEGVPDGAKSAQLELREAKLLGLWKIDPEVTELMLGNLDPIAGDTKQATRSVQKLLSNLGRYSGPIDGEYSADLRAALVGFQQACGIEPAHGLADEETVKRLAERQKAPSPKPLDQKKDDSLDAPLGLGEEASERREKVTVFSDYVEPTEPDQSKESRLGKFRFFPPRAYVALSDPGKEADNPNLLQMPTRRFLHLDVGRWIDSSSTKARDFGLIWGRHVSLCRYVPGGNQSNAPKRKKGLDVDFLTASPLAKHVEVVKSASAWWAPYGDFHWDRLYVVIPDLHLMSKTHGEHWHPEGFDFGPETHLSEFAGKLAAVPAPLRDSLEVLQIGDSYDLWVGCEPYFLISDKAHDKGRVLELTKPEDKAIEQLKKWIEEIQKDAPGGKNPAMTAFETLERAFGGRFHYLYGNHDNYLALPPVCAAAGLRPRVRFVERPGVFIEHGHRMEGRFVVSAGIPHNYDGTDTGYKATVKAYNSGGGMLTNIAKKIADEWAAIHDRAEYVGEQAQVWLGRQSRGTLKPPHVFVIGHTHIPDLITIDIDAYRK